MPYRIFFELWHKIFIELIVKIKTQNQVLNGKVNGKKFKTKQLKFVVHEHLASHWHHDLRLELNGVLKSWAVPKGMNFKKGEKRLAIEVEDHTLNYQNFEGIIPLGQYGAGKVSIWDKGVYHLENDNGYKKDEFESEIFNEEKEIQKNLNKGKLKINLEGKKLNGKYILVRTQKKENWLILKTGLS